MVKTDILKLIEEKAKSTPRRILLVEGEEERLIKAAVLAVEQGTAIPVLLGRKSVIEATARTSSLSLNGVEIIAHLEHPELDAFVNQLVELRKHKGMTPEKAKEALLNPNMFGALLLKLGKVDGAVGGCKFSTADWMRPVFQVIGTKKDVSLVSAVCFFILGKKTYFFSDTDFNIKPNAEQLAQIAVNASDFVQALGITPKLALLSYSTKGSGEHESLAPIREALALVKTKYPKMIIDGEIQLDAAMNPSAAQKKCPDSILKGDANVFIFPDITVGNVLTHGLMQWTPAVFFGSFPVGLAKPIINGGRSMNAEQIANLITACAMEANF